MGPFFIYTYCYDFEAIGLVEGIDERLKYWLKDEAWFGLSLWSSTVFYWLEVDT